MKTDKSKVIIVSVISLLVVFLIVYPILISKKKNPTSDIEVFQVPREVKEEHERKISQAFQYDKEKDYLNIMSRNTTMDSSPSNDSSAAMDSLRQQIAELQQQVISLKNRNNVRYSTRVAEPKKEQPVKDEPYAKNEQTVTRTIVKEDFSGTEPQGVDGNTVSNIEAVIPMDQTVSNGSKVKIRTTEKAVINGVYLNPNTYLYGQARLAKERVFISIQSVFINDEIIKTDISVFDIDGSEGVYTPGLMMQEVVGDNVSRGIGAANIRLPVGGRLSLNPVKSKAQQTVTLLSNHKVILSLN